MPVNGQVAVVLMWMWVVAAVCTGVVLTALLGNASLQLDFDGHPLPSAVMTASAVLHWLQVWFIAHVTVRLTQGYAWARRWAIALTVIAFVLGAASGALTIATRSAAVPAVPAACGGMVLQAIVFGLLIPENLRRWANRQRTSNRSTAVRRIGEVRDQFYACARRDLGISGPISGA